ncbi:MAG: phosphate propanoyltransferase [Bacilli bacterium]|nr:phosphate propanoyltransferase [Bacilli bacterium]
MNKEMIRMEVTLGVSNRHVHLNLEDFEALFGKNQELEVKKELVQPEQFASNNTVVVKTEKSELKNVRVLGPIRNYTQVEVSKTDAYKLGINPPVRDSGDLEGAEEVEIVGPNGSIKRKSAIIATRHLHITDEMIKEYGLDGIEEVSVEKKGEKGVIFKNVKLKVQEKSVLELHLDTDDANGSLLKTGDILTVIK